MANTHDVPGSSVAAPEARLQIDPDYQELAREHHLLDQQIHALTAQGHLTSAQHLEELTLKKKKLAIKDRIAALTAARQR